MEPYYQALQVKTWKILLVVFSQMRWAHLGFHFSQTIELKSFKVFGAF